MAPGALANRVSRRPESVRFGDLRRLAPISAAFGFDRGQPVDRYYIEGFLQRNAARIRGRVLEVGDSGYTERFGGSRVSAADVLDRKPDNPAATIVADLARPGALPRDRFDCAIVTQTLQFIYDLTAAVGALHDSLRPEGALLVTVPALSRICREDMQTTGEYWRFTEASVERLLEEVFGAARVAVEAHGNVLTAVAFLHGLAAEELEREELDHRDPDFPVLITGLAVRRT